MPEIIGVNAGVDVGIGVGVDIGVGVRVDVGMVPHFLHDIS